MTANRLDKADGLDALYNSSISSVTGVALTTEPFQSVIRLDFKVDGNVDGKSQSASCCGCDSPFESVTLS